MKKIFNNLRLRFTSFVKNNKKEFWILLAILVIAAVFRLYKIDQYMTFLGDEGRDVVIVRRIFTELHPPLIGPGTSIGGMYLGPLYYYMMAIPLLIANFSPVGPAVMVAILGIITVAFVWWVGRDWIGKTAGLIAAALYAISPTVIYYSRSSWNPNIMPFFALLSIYSIWKVWREKKFNWIIVMGIAVAFALQSHYLGLLLIPTLFVFWFISFLGVRKTNLLKAFIKKSIIGLATFILLMSPLFFFDVRHGWMNTKAIYTFFTIRQTTVSIRPWTAIPKIPELLDQINSTLIGGKVITGGKIITAIFAICVIGLLIYVIKNGKKGLTKINPAYYLLATWFGFALIGFGLYKQNIYDHYFGFIFMLPPLIISAFISTLWGRGKILKIVGLTLLGYLVVINLMVSPLGKEPNNLLRRSINVTDVIKKESGGKPFNIAVIADNNYEAAYEYFLLNDNYPVTHIDAQVPSTITDQLFVVCELIPNEKCDPVHSPKAQIASFGWSKIESSWNIDGAVLYKLVHTN